LLQAFPLKVDGNFGLNELYGAQSRRRACPLFATWGRMATWGNNTIFKVLIKVSFAARLFSFLGRTSFP
jgi:hypothetical protein